MSWSDLADWWVEELEGDAAYEEVVTPLLFDMFEVEPGARYLDLGSGEGRLMRAVADRGGEAIGVDDNSELAALSSGQVVISRIPDVPFSTNSFDGAYMVLTLEHIADHRAVFAETSRVVGPGGVMALVMNHPAWTAPGSTPIADSDGEVLWRPGDYFSNGSSEIPAGKGSVIFHHRTMADLLSAAANAGWNLEKIVERPHHELEDQPGIPRLLACGWKLGD